MNMDRCLRNWGIAWTACMMLLCAAIAGFVLGAALCALTGCGATYRKVTTPEQRTIITKWVNCMARPPKVEDIDWPDADRTGNLLLHASTAERVKAAYGIAVRYISEQWRKCRAEVEGKESDAAEMPDGGSTVEVEVTP